MKRFCNHVPSLIKNICMRTGESSCGDCKYYSDPCYERWEETKGCDDRRCEGCKYNIDEIDKIKETKMKDETLTLKVKDIKRAHDNACEDGKKIIKDMCPKAFEGKERDITMDIVWKSEEISSEGRNNGMAYLYGYYNGKSLVYLHMQNPDSMQICRDTVGQYKLEHKGQLFRVIKL